MEKHEIIKARLIEKLEDKDKEKESRLFSLYLNNLGLYSEVRVTNLDPKEYSTEEIRRIVESKATDTTSTP